MSRAFLIVLVSLTAFVPAAAAQELTIYSSLPLRGASEDQTKAIVTGAQRALADAGGQAGGRPIRYVSLDDSTADAGTWTPEATAANARRAAQDPSTIAYLGEFNSGASAISIPILNDAGILQISPSNTAVGLTQSGPGADAGEPVKYYPTGRRTYARIAPNDRVQGRAAGALMKRLRVRRAIVLHDGEIYGKGVARLAAASMRRRGIRVLAVRQIDPRASNYRSFASRYRRADGMFYGGITANGAVQLWKDFSAANPELEKVGSDGVAESAFADPRDGGIPFSVARNTHVLVNTLAPDAYPRAGRAFFRSIGNDPDPYAIYGYEAMALALDAINRGGPTREGAVGAAFATRNRNSVLGRYSITRLGDTTLTKFGVYRIVRGELRFDRVIDAG